MIEGRYEWAVCTKDGHIVHMSSTKEKAQRWANLRKGVYIVRPLTDDDFEPTTHFGIKS